MVERNLIAEGFVRNTLNELGSVSGTQVVSIPQLEALVDEDFSTTAVTVTGSFFISLDADLGARWKLNRIELYTDEPSPSNFDMSVSVDNEDFLPITMTGSAGLWVGSVSGTTVSGTPRYLRYEQRATVDRTVEEWRAINDDTLVDFGSAGTQTEVEIEDAPIGRPSAQIVELPLFNRFTKTAQGFVFIDETGTNADDNIEMSLTSNGPWFGNLNQAARQPDPLKWIEFSEVNHPAYSKGQPDGPANQNQPTNAFVNENQQGILQNLRVVSGTAYRADFSGGTAKGWTTVGFASAGIVGGAQEGDGSTIVNPKYIFAQNFGTTAAVSPDSAASISNGFNPFRAEDYDTVEVRLTNPGTMVLSDLSEGPRFFWKTHHMTSFDTDHSTLSITPNAIGNGNPQTFRFNMGNITTWSGIIVGFQIQPWTTVTGLGFTGAHHYTEIYEDGISKADRVALEFDSVVSGTFIGLTAGSSTSASEWRIVINTENVIKEPCIITSVSAPSRQSASTTLDHEGWFLCRFRDGFVYNDSATEVNVGAADPFIVKEVAVNTVHHNVNQILNARKPVYWFAEPGDMIGYGYRSFSGNIFEGPQLRYDTNLSTTTNGALANSNFMDIRTTSDLQTAMNNSTSWFTTGRRPNVQFKAISAGKYFGTGFYNTPVFDGGGNPALLSFEIDTTEENGTSIDVDTGETNKTVYARASNLPPNTSARLGFRKRQFMMGAHPSDIPSRFDPKYESNYVIGLMNPEVEARENVTSAAGDTQIENMASNLLYHEVNQELWALNINISGTINTNMRPIWDVYDVSDGQTPSYVRTQHVTGNIAYTHNNNTTAAAANVFEPVGFVADYDREEIYIITREDEFAVGNGTYNGIILDLDGEYKDVFWRNSQLTQDIVNKGVETTTALADRHLQNMRTVVYKVPYFYALTNNLTGDDAAEGTHLNVYRLGNNPLSPNDPNDVEFIGEIDLGTVPGLTTVSTASPADTISYCSANDLFYFTKDDGDDIFTFRSSITGTPPNESVVITASPITQTAAQLFTTANLTEFFNANVAFANNNPWRGSGEDQQLKRLVDLTYDTDRDSFWHLINYRGNRSQDFVREGEYSLSDFFWHFHNHSVLMELGAEAQGASLDTPRYPNPTDPVWGTLSGTLAFEEVASNGILFPTGRYAQLRYQLNSDPGRQYTPYISSSRLSQGIRVSDIPAGSTKSIYLRTNIPETETVGDQAGRLKIYWELRGD
jgi:hypothetical protein